MSVAGYTISCFNTAVFIWWLSRCVFGPRFMAYEGVFSKCVTVLSMYLDHIYKLSHWCAIYSFLFDRCLTAYYHELASRQYMICIRHCADVYDVSHYVIFVLHTYSCIWYCIWYCIVLYTCRYGRISSDGVQCRWLGVDSWSCRGSVQSDSHESSLSGE